MTTYLKITPRDPLIARDARPFDSGARMKPLDWLMPSVVAGSLRSLLGKQRPEAFTPEIVEQLKAVQVAGVFPVVPGSGVDTLFLPAPADAVLHPGGWLLKAVPRNVKAEGGCNLPHTDLRPVQLVTDRLHPDEADFKPEPLPAFWSCRAVTDWLLDTGATGPYLSRGDAHYRDAPVRDQRMHVRLDSASGTAEDGQLFSTCGLTLSTLLRYGSSAVASDESAARAAELKAVSDGLWLAARVTAEGQFGELCERLNQWHPLGGERRNACWQATPPADSTRGSAPHDGICDITRLWACPDRVIARFEQADATETRVRMMLATPAVFEANGWFPDWLDAGTLTGSPPGSSVTLKLVSACIDRWQPISGWSLEKGKGGPKALQRMVPAGSVFFFEQTAGDGVTLPQSLWLNSVCGTSDGSQNQWARDGFGLALWGLW